MIEFICINIIACIILAIFHLWRKKHNCEHTWSDWHPTGPVYDRFWTRVCLKCNKTSTKDFYE